MDNSNKCKTISFFSFLSVVILGTLFHFAFAYSGYSTIVGAFTPVNESIWEHLKLLIFPSIIIAIPEYILHTNRRRDFIISKIISLLIGITFIVTSFYTYTGITGNHNFIIDIIIFIVACALSSYLTCIIISSKKFHFSDNKAIIMVLILTAMILLFVYYTFDPPQIELFRDPISEDFGMQYDI